MMDKSAVVQYLSVLVTLGLIVLDVPSLVSGQLNGRDASKSSGKYSQQQQQQKIVMGPIRYMYPMKQLLPPTSLFDYVSIPAAAADTSFPGNVLRQYTLDREMKNMNRYYMPEQQPSSADQTEFVSMYNDRMMTPNDLFNSARFSTGPQFAINTKNQRLMSSNSNNEAEAAAAADNQQDAINIQTRSLTGGAGTGSSTNNIANGLGGAAFSSVPRSFINILYGRPGSAAGLPGLPGIGGYNKKAEPKDNFFMHFG